MHAHQPVELILTHSHLRTLAFEPVRIDSMRDLHYVARVNEAVGSNKAPSVTLDMALAHILRQRSWPVNFTTRT